MLRAAQFAIGTGYVTARGIAAAVNVPESAAEVILDALVEDGIVNAPLVGDMSGKYIVAVDQLPDHYRADDDDDPTAEA